MNCNLEESPKLKDGRKEKQEFSSRELKYIELPLPEMAGQWPKSQFPEKIELHQLPESDVTRWIDNDGQHDYSRKIQLLCALSFITKETCLQADTTRIQEWDQKSIHIEGLSETPLPFSKATFDKLKELRWLTAEWAYQWHSDSGGSAPLTTDIPWQPGFILQTPNDGGPFCSLSIVANQLGAGGVFIIDKSFDVNSLLANQEYHTPKRATSESYVNIKPDFSLLPIRILEWHVANTVNQLTDLKKRVSRIESKVGSMSESANYGDLISEVNRCSALQLVLERRWRFELTLARNLSTYFVGISKIYEAKRKHDPSTYPSNSIQRVTFQLQLSEGLEYDISILPRRVKLQQAAIRSIIDTAIANSTREIALESHRDSLSMKTIAILTLVFLPGTFVASFFSMTMFNWQAGLGENLVSTYLWVYFIVTVPLTIMVITAWYWWLHTQTKKHQVDLESLLSTPISNTSLDVLKRKTE